MSKVITVSTRAELYSALSTATGGETIKLAEGDYGGFGLKPGTIPNVTFPSTVTITSLDPTKPAVFSSLFLKDVTNLAFDGVVFDYTFKEGDIYNLRPFEVQSSTNVAIRNSVFDGDVAAGRGELADGYGTAIALSVRDSKGISVEGNEFFAWWRGLTISNTNDVTVAGNEIHDMRSDGMNFVAVQGVRIENNYIHDFRLSPLSGDHPDMIQFWTSGTTKPSTDIIIRNNILDIGDGDWTQSIFMRNEMVDTGKAGAEMFYRNVLIENNTIYNSHLHGITVGETSGLIIRDNSVLHVPDTSLASGGISPVNVPTIRVAARSEGVSIIDNVTAAITGGSGQASWTIKNNAFVQSTDPFGVGYYGDVFVDSTILAKSGPHNFIVEAAGLIAKLGAGSSAIQIAEAANIGEALFTVSTVNSSAAARVFDASPMKLVTGKDLPESSYVWTFSDGSTATGKIVTHTFPAGGNYDATLTVKMPNGSLSTSTSTLTLAGSQVVSFDSDSGAFRAFSAGTDTLLSQLASLDDGAIQLQRTGTVASVWQVGALKGADDFEINLTLKADQVGVGGEVFRVHGAFVATVTGAGQFIISFSSSDGKSYALKGSTSLPVNDGKAHDISIRVADGTMELLVDGQTAAEGSFNGTLPTSGLQALTFGNPWGKVNFLGDVQAFSIDVDVGHYPGVPVTVGATPVTTPEPVVVAPVDQIAPVEQGEPARQTAPVAEPEPIRIDPLHGEDWGGFVLDIAALTSRPKALLDDARVVTGNDGAKIVLDGDKDYVNIGRLGNFEMSDKLAFSVDFTRNEGASADDRLVWNHMRLGLTVNDDSLTIHVATADKGFVAYTARGLDIATDTLHRATVMVDTETDRLQLIYNNAVVLDVSGPDFDMPGGYQWGWMLGTPWNRYYDGEIHDFRIGDQFTFVEPLAAGGLNL